jgi:outer membrane scaffolding protein for murein synthesis (MipA/OmpV family)
MNHAHHRIKSVSLAAGIALVASHAFAQGFDTVRLTSAAPGTDGGTVGAAIFITDEYQGSEKRRTLVLPVIDYQWANGWFAGVTNGIGVNFSGSPQNQYGLRLTVDKGRKQDRASSLRGMGDVDAAAEGGAFFNHALSEGFVLNSSVRVGAGDRHKGLVVDLGVGYSTEIAPRWYLSTGAGATFVNTHYMRSFFGVTGAQSVASGYAVYSPGSGARDLRANLALTYSISPKTSVTAAVSASSLVGEAKASPLTQKRTSEAGVVAIRYAF